jgi:hypothetical protein
VPGGQLGQAGQLPGLDNLQKVLGLYTGQVYTAKIFFFFLIFFWGIFSFCSYNIQHCFICRPSDSTVPTDAGIEPRTVATCALAVRRSVRLGYISSALGYISSALGYISSALGYISSALGYISSHLIIHCKDTIPKIRNIYSQISNCTATVPIPTFMFLSAIYIFPRMVCILCCRKIGIPILGIRKSLTDT